MEEVAHLFMDHKRARVRECQVRVNKYDYAPTDGVQAELMMHRNETNVLVAYDPLDPSRVAVLDDAGHLLTMLDRKAEVRMAPDDPATQQQVEAMMQMRSRLTRGLKNQRLEIIRAGKQIGVQSPLQLLTGSSADADQGEAFDTFSAFDSERITPRKPAPAELPTVDGAKLHTDDIIARFKARQLSGGTR
jgi:hypothetical protein